MSGTKMVNVEGNNSSYVSNLQCVVLVPLHPFLPIVSFLLTLRLLPTLHPYLRLLTLLFVVCSCNERVLGRDQEWNNVSEVRLSDFRRVSNLRRGDPISRQLTLSNISHLMFWYYKKNHWPGKFFSSYSVCNRVPRSFHAFVNLATQVLLEI